MQTPDARNPAGGRGFARVQAHGDELPAKHTAGAPLALLLNRLERVRRAGNGYTARCPAHEDRTASLSLSEGSDGRALLHCFAGCSALDVVHALGLEVGDLFPQRLPPTTPEAKRAARQRAREADTAAALRILAFECRVVEAAAAHLVTDRPLPWSDLRRLAQAADRIAAARDRLAPPRPWRPEARA